MTTNDTTPKASKPRVNRTPAQKAQDLLDAAKARYGRAEVAAGKAKKTLADAQSARDDAHAELDAAKAAVDYASKHPDLPKSVNIGTVTIEVPVNVSPGVKS